MKQTKIFISHSSFDAEVANALTDLLVHGIGIDRKLIFCSSSGDVPVGVNFNDFILKQIKGYDTQVIALISNNYYNRKYCLYELGAAWGLCKKNRIIPVLIHGMKNGNLQDFISHTESVNGESELDINKLLDYFKSYTTFPRENVPQTRYENERKKFVSFVKEKRLKIESKSKDLKQSSFKYKVVAFDFDGTILQGENYKHSWKEIWQYQNHDEAIRRELNKKHKNNHQEYTFQNWCDECVEHFMERNFKRTDITQIIENRKLKIAEGFDILIQLLSEFGIKTVIISGGINTFVTETVSQQTYDLFDKIYINEFIYDKDGYLKKVRAYQNGESDSVGKTKTLEKYCIERGYDLSEVVFVGDDINDIDIGTEVGLSLAFPALKANPNNIALNKHNSKHFKPIYHNNIATILAEVLIFNE